MQDRKPNEEQREWLKRCMCQYHWQQTTYYQAKLDQQLEMSENAKELFRKVQ